MKADLVNLGVGQAAGIAIMGYLVVFLGLILLMCVILVMANIFINKARQAAAAAAAAVPEAPVKAAEPAPEPVKKPVAPGTAGELKLYDTDPRDAAMIMAIVANATGKNLNELRFKSIKEVK